MKLLVSLIAAPQACAGAVLPTVSVILIVTCLVIVVVI